MLNRDTLDLPAPIEDYDRETAPTLPVVIRWHHNPGSGRGWYALHAPGVPSALVSRIPTIEVARYLACDYFPGAPVSVFGPPLHTEPR